VQFKLDIDGAPVYVSTCGQDHRAGQPVVVCRTVKAILWEYALCCSLLLYLSSSCIPTLGTKSFGYRIDPTMTTLQVTTYGAYNLLFTK
jgi:hypothetical protein